MFFVKTRPSPFPGKPVLKLNRPLSLGGHVESRENKKLCFCKASLALNLHLDEGELLFLKVFSFDRSPWAPAFDE